MPVGNSTMGNFTNYGVDYDEAKIQLKGKKGEEPKEKYSYIEGYLTKVEASEYEFEGEMIQTIKFYFKDDEINYDVLECGRYTTFVRGALSCLVNLDAIDYIRLTPYNSDEEFNGKKLTHCGVRHNDNKVARKYKKGDYPEAVAAKVGKKEYLNTEKRDEFFDNLIPEINAKLVHKFKSGSNSNAEATNNTNNGYKPYSVAKNGKTTEQNLEDNIIQEEDIPF
jgi:hypothetical protein